MGFFNEVLQLIGKAVNVVMDKARYPPADCNSENGSVYYTPAHEFTLFTIPNISKGQV